MSTVVATVRCSTIRKVRSRIVSTGRISIFARASVLGALHG